MTMDQLDIFGAAVLLGGTRLDQAGELPVGCIIVRDFVTADEEHDVAVAIDEAEWNVDMKRRVQQYGYRYDYKARAVSASDRIGTLPEWAIPTAQRLVDCEYFATLPDQVIVNEYTPGQGISPHTDRTTCFGPTIASLSLGSDVVMDFTNSTGKAGAVVLPRRSLLVLSGSARSEWRHGIAQRRRDTINGRDHARGRRLSLTFRTVLAT